MASRFDTLVRISCYKCGALFGMSEAHNSQRLEDQDDFYCPNGHRQHYTGENTSKRLQKATRKIAKLEALVEDLTGERDELQAALDELQAQWDALDSTDPEDEIDLLMNSIKQDREALSARVAQITDAMTGWLREQPEYLEGAAPAPGVH